MKIKFFTLALMLGSALLSAQTQVVDLSTGVNNTTGLLLATGSVDDTWTVKVPSSGTYQNALVSTGYLGPPITHGAHYAFNSAANWISPYVDLTPGSTFGEIDNNAAPGDYIYKTSFTKISCNVTAVTLNLSLVGADNTITSISINGHAHSLSSYSIDFSTLQTITMSIPTTDIGTGVNDILITLNNETGGNNPTGMYISGNLSVTYQAPIVLTPAITGASAFCSGYPIAVTGSSSPAATNTYWELVECDASGNTVTGGYSWSNWYLGTPGAFTFPVYPTCGKYYRIKLAVQNPCVVWSEVTKVIYINCTPTANGGPDVNVCKGSCVTIGVSGTAGRAISYQWTGPSGAVGSTQTVSVCPTTTTTYTYTVTNTITGCFSTDVVTVNVTDNDPSFSYASNTSNPSYFTLAATPNNTSVSSITGFGYAWSIEELDASNAQLFVISNPSCWWTFSPPSVIVNNFNGFDHTAYSYSGTSTLASCSTPTLGKFLYNHKYRITRGTWSDVCAWQQYSLILTSVKSLNGGASIIATEDDRAPDMSYMMTSVDNVSVAASENISVYPNPGTGVFTVELATASKTSIEVYDALGKKVKASEQNGSKTVVDLTGFPKGIYMVNIISEGKLTSKKIILE